MRALATPLAALLFLSFTQCSDPQCADNELKVGSVCRPVNRATDGSVASSTAGDSGLGADDESDGRAAVATERDASASNQGDTGPRQVLPSGEDAGQLSQPPGGDASQLPPERSCSDCDPAATCTPGADRLCTCPLNSSDDRGDGTLCLDPCASASCDSNATCSASGGVAKCTCNAAYVGDGTQCTFDQTCSLLKCDPNAECAVSGTTRACECKAGFSGPGTSCSNINECSTGSPCGPNGTCVDSPGSYSCSCKPGYSGAKCEVDACSPNPCASGLTCNRTAQGASCVPACAPHCSAGTACTGDNQCVSGATCDSQSKVCLLNSCTGGMLSYPGDVDRLRYCASIAGSVSAMLTNSSLMSIDLPYLKSVSGSLYVEGGTLSLFRLPALETVGGDFTANQVICDLLDTPKLRSVGGTLKAGVVGFLHLDLGRLETVGKDLWLEGLLNANTINVTSVKTVSGAVILGQMPSIPWSSVSRLQSLGASQRISAIGCNVCPDNSVNRYMCSSGATCP